MGIKRASNKRQGARNIDIDVEVELEIQRQRQMEKVAKQEEDVLTHQDNENEHDAYIDKEITDAHLILNQEGELGQHSHERTMMSGGTFSTTNNKQMQSKFITAGFSQQLQPTNPDRQFEVKTLVEKKSNRRIKNSKQQQKYSNLNETTGNISLMEDRIRHYLNESQNRSTAQSQMLMNIQSNNVSQFIPQSDGKSYSQTPPEVGQLRTKKSSAYGNKNQSLMSQNINQNSLHQSIHQHKNSDSMMQSSQINDRNFQLQTFGCQINKRHVAGFQGEQNNGNDISTVFNITDGHGFGKRKGRYDKKMGLKEQIDPKKVIEHTLQSQTNCFLPNYKMNQHIRRLQNSHKLYKVGSDETKDQTTSGLTSKTNLFGNPDQKPLNKKRSRPKHSKKERKNKRELDLIVTNFGANNQGLSQPQQQADYLNKSLPYVIHQTHGMLDQSRINASSSQGGISETWKSRQAADFKLSQPSDNLGSINLAKYYEQLTPQLHANLRGSRSINVVSKKMAKNYTNENLVQRKHQNSSLGAWAGAQQNSSPSNVAASDPENLTITQANRSSDNGRGSRNYRQDLHLHDQTSSKLSIENPSPINTDMAMFDDLRQLQPRNLQQNPSSNYQLLTTTQEKRLLQLQIQTTSNHPQQNPSQSQATNFLNQVYPNSQNSSQYQHYQQHLLQQQQLQQLNVNSDMGSGAETLAIEKSTASDQRFLEAQRIVRGQQADYSIEEVKSEVMSSPGMSQNESLEQRDGQARIGERAKRAPIQSKIDGKIRKAGGSGVAARPSGIQDLNLENKMISLPDNHGEASISSQQNNDNFNSSKLELNDHQTLEQLNSFLSKSIDVVIQRNSSTSKNQMAMFQQEEEKDSSPSRNITQIHHSSFKNKRAQGINQKQREASLKFLPPTAKAQIKNSSIKAQANQINSLSQIIETRPLARQRSDATPKDKKILSKKQQINATSSKQEVDDYNVVRKTPPTQRNKNQKLESILQNKELAQFSISIRGKPFLQSKSKDNLNNIDNQAPLNLDLQSQFQTNQHFDQQKQEGLINYKSEDNYKIDEHIPRENNNLSSQNYQSSNVTNHQINQYGGIYDTGTQDSQMQKFQNRYELNDDSPFIYKSKGTPKEGESKMERAHFPENLKQQNEGKYQGNYSLSISQNASEGHPTLLQIPLMNHSRGAQSLSVTPLCEPVYQNLTIQQSKDRIPRDSRQAAAILEESGSSYLNNQDRFISIEQVEAMKDIQKEQRLNIQVNQSQLQQRSSSLGLQRSLIQDSSYQFKKNEDASVIHLQQLVQVSLDDLGNESQFYMLPVSADNTPQMRLLQNSNSMKENDVYMKNQQNQKSQDLTDPSMLIDQSPQHQADQNFQQLQVYMGYGLPHSYLNQNQENQQNGLDDLRLTPAQKQLIYQLNQVPMTLQQRIQFQRKLVVADQTYKFNPYIYERKADQENERLIYNRIKAENERLSQSLSVSGTNIKTIGERMQNAIDHYTQHLDYLKQMHVAQVQLHNQQTSPLVQGSATDSSSPLNYPHLMPNLPQQLQLNMPQMPILPQSQSTLLNNSNFHHSKFDSLAFSQQYMMDNKFQASGGTGHDGFGAVSISNQGTQRNQQVQQLQSLGSGINFMYSMSLENSEALKASGGTNKNLCLQNSLKGERNHQDNQLITSHPFSFMQNKQSTGSNQMQGNGLSDPYMQMQDFSKHLHHNNSSIMFQSDLTEMQAIQTKNDLQFYQNQEQNKQEVQSMMNESLRNSLLIPGQPQQEQLKSSRGPQPNQSPLESIKKFFSPTPIINQSKSNLIDQNDPLLQEVRHHRQEENSKSLSSDKAGVLDQPLSMTELNVNNKSEMGKSPTSHQSQHQKIILISGQEKHQNQIQTIQHENSPQEHQNSLQSQPLTHPTLQAHLKNHAKVETKSPASRKQSKVIQDQKAVRSGSKSPPQQRDFASPYQDLRKDQGRRRGDTINSQQNQRKNASANSSYRKNHNQYQDKHFTLQQYSLSQHNAHNSSGGAKGFNEESEDHISYKITRPILNQMEESGAFTLNNLISGDNKNDPPPNIQLQSDLKTSKIYPLTPDTRIVGQRIKGRGSTGISAQGNFNFYQAQKEEDDDDESRDQNHKQDIDEYKLAMSYSKLHSQIGSELQHIGLKSVKELNQLKQNPLLTKAQNERLMTSFGLYRNTNDEENKDLNQDIPANSRSVKPLSARKKKEIFVNITASISTASFKNERRAGNGTGVMITDTVNSSRQVQIKTPKIGNIVTDQSFRPNDYIEKGETDISQNNQSRSKIRNQQYQISQYNLAEQRLVSDPEIISSEILTRNQQINQSPTEKQRLTSQGKIFDEERQQQNKLLALKSNRLTQRLESLNKHTLYNSFVHNNRRVVSTQNKSKQMTNLSQDMEQGFYNNQTKLNDTHARIQSASQSFNRHNQNKVNENSLGNSNTNGSQTIFGKTYLSNSNINIVQSSKQKINSYSLGNNPKQAFENNQYNSQTSMVNPLLQNTSSKSIDPSQIRSVATAPSKSTAPVFRQNRPSTASYLLRNSMQPLPVHFKNVGSSLNSQQLGVLKHQIFQNDKIIETSESFDVQSNTQLTIQGEFSDRKKKPSLWQNAPLQGRPLKSSYTRKSNEKGGVISQLSTNNLSNVQESNYQMLGVGGGGSYINLQSKTQSNFYQNRNSSTNQNQMNRTNKTFSESQSNYNMNAKSQRQNRLMSASYSHQRDPGLSSKSFKNKDANQNDIDSFSNFRVANQIQGIDSQNNKGPLSNKNRAMTAGGRTRMSSNQLDIYKRLKRGVVFKDEQFEAKEQRDGIKIISMY